MTTAKNGDRVKVHYTGKLEDGKVFDSSRERDPLEFTLGGGDVIPGFDAGVQGMAVSESKTVEVSPAEAYGPHRSELVAVVSRDDMPKGLLLKVDQGLRITQPSGPPLAVVVKEVTDTTVTLDGNHLLAGKTLTFELELVAIGDAATAEA